MSDRDVLPTGTEATKTGTTTVGLVCSDGVILASDKRASAGYFIASKDIEKIHAIDDRIAMTIAGGVGDAQALIRLMKAELKLYKLKQGRPMSTRAAANLLANMLHQYRFYPFMVQLLVAGVEDNEGIYSIDAFGGITEEKYVSTGSGSPIAYGHLESAYQENGNIKDNMKVAAKAVQVAIKRDCASGEDIDLVTITKDGFKRHSKEEILKLLGPEKR